MRAGKAVCYYSSLGGKLLVANSGLILSVAVSVAYPRIGAVAVAGAVASRGTNWLAKKLDDATGLHLARLHDALVTQVAHTHGRQIVAAHNTLASPMRSISTSVQVGKEQGYLINEDVLYELLAPIVEELMFRFAGQELVFQTLLRLGVPSDGATSIALSLSSSLFAFAHNPDPQSGLFKTNLIAGIIFGGLAHFHGLPAAMVAHSLNNASIGGLGPRFWRAIGR